MQPTFAGVVRGEWIKLLSLRSTWWALASTAAVITLVALAAAASLNAMAEDPALAPGIEQMHGAEVISSGFHFGMLTIAVHEQDRAAPGMVQSCHQRGLLAEIA